MYNVIIVSYNIIDELETELDLGKRDDDELMKLIQSLMASTLWSELINIGGSDGLLELTLPELLIGDIILTTATIFPPKRLNNFIADNSDVDLLKLL